MCFSVELINANTVEADQNKVFISFYMLVENKVFISSRHVITYVTTGIPQGEGDKYFQKYNSQTDLFQYHKGPWA